jgi:hypothetical protein
MYGVSCWNKVYIILVGFRLQKTGTTARNRRWVPNARTFSSLPGFGFGWFYFCDLSASVLSEKSEERLAHFLFCLGVALELK